MSKKKQQIDEVLIGGRCPADKHDLTNLNWRKYIRTRTNKRSDGTRGKPYRGPYFCCLDCHFDRRFTDGRKIPIILRREGEPK